MIKHVVLLNWKEGTSQADIDAVTTAFAQLGDELDEIQSYQFGPDLGLYPDNADYALVAEFASEADLKTYVKHPRHYELLSNVAGPLLDSFQAVQFTVNP